jgi:hypothetical protein
MENIKDAISYNNALDNTLYVPRELVLQISSSLSHFDALVLA